MATEERLVAVKDLDERYGVFRLGRPDRVAALRQSVASHGLLQPILVNNVSEGGLVVLDGFKRLRVVRELGQAEIRALVVCLNDKQARAAMVTYNAAPSGGLCELEEAWIVRSLVRECAMPQKDVAVLLGRHKSWVCRRLMLAEQLSSTVHDDMRLGLLSASVAREVVRLPRGNQDSAAMAIRSHGLSSRQASDLVGRLLSASDEAAASALLADPLRFLQDKAELPAPRPTDPRLSPGGEEIRQSLVRFEQCAAGLKVALGRNPMRRIAVSDRVVLAPTALDVSRVAKSLATTLAAWPQDEEVPSHA